MAYIYGIDETCKCPVIGSLPVCIVKVDENFFNQSNIKKLPIKDSKITTLKQREKVFQSLSLKIDYTTQCIYPTGMDENLIDLEIKAIINGLKELGYKYGEKVYIDLFDSTSDNLIKRFIKFGFRTKFSNWVIKHGADSKYKVVALASIFSKVYSDKELGSLKRRFNIGSGNPSDIITLKFLIDNYDNLPWFVRKKWLTVQRLKNPFFRAYLKGMINSGCHKKYGSLNIREIYRKCLRLSRK